MLHLRLCQSLPPLFLAYSSIHNQERSIFPFPYVDFKGIRNGAVSAADKDSDFEVDPDKAREALRKLDEQMLSLSSKKVDPPKIRAVDIKQSSFRVKEETPELSGSFLASVATVLLVFSIFYNVLFLTVIKPSIDGDPSVFRLSKSEADQETVSQQLYPSPEIPVVP